MPIETRSEGEFYHIRFGDDYASRGAPQLPTDIEALQALLAAALLERDAALTERDKAPSRILWRCSERGAQHSLAVRVPPDPPAEIGKVDCCGGILRAQPQRAVESVLDRDSLQLGGCDERSRTG
jgi:hypothetical protein